MGFETLHDQEMPLLAAQWLAEGSDSAELRELAALSSGDRVKARRALPVGSTDCSSRGSVVDLLAVVAEFMPGLDFGGLGLGHGLGEAAL